MTRSVTIVNTSNWEHENVEVTVVSKTEYQKSNPYSLGIHVMLDLTLMVSL